MSAIAPAAIENNMVGSMAAVCTSATLSADDVISVIAQAAPTPCTSMPKFDSKLASQMRRNTGSRRGAPMPSEVRGGVVEVRWSIPESRLLESAQSVSQSFRLAAITKGGDELPL